jgi:hypothetical protein
MDVQSTIEVTMSSKDLQTAIKRFLTSEGFDMQGAATFNIINANNGQSYPDDDYDPPSVKSASVTVKKTVSSNYYQDR